MRTVIRRDCVCPTRRTGATGAIDPERGRTARTWRNKILTRHECHKHLSRDQLQFKQNRKRSDHSSYGIINR
ncbi:hypothetical protein PUN28_014889 [Cardiocondyla obscurior]|uniref:Uncharacterized protein n=1 Tax=Cardiocondyla obscurior TaxID=286306 RepID=A0AAW2EW05_9HYME